MLSRLHGKKHRRRLPSRKEFMNRLETDQLILRHFQMEDAQEVYEILGDKEVNRFLPMFPLESIEEAKDYIQIHYLDRYAKGDVHRYAICMKQDEKAIGYIHVSSEENHDFGYGLKKEFWHQGIVSQAGKLLLESLKDSDIPFITATHDVKNPNSGLVMRKLGMVYQYSYKEQWQPKNIPVTFRMYQMNLHCPESFVYEKYKKMYPFFVENI